MSAAVTPISGARQKRAAKVASGKTMRATLDDLKRAVVARDDMPARLSHAKAKDVVGVTALVLGFCSLDRVLVLDLGNGHELLCSVREAAVCAG